MSQGAPLAELQTALATITTANGYHHTVRSVLTGRASLVTIDALTGAEPLPLLTINTRSERPEAELRSTLASQSWTKTVIVQGFLRATDTWDDDLDRLADDLRRCLFLLRWPSSAAQWTEMRFYPPESGGNISQLQAELQMLYITTFSP
jgi:hypothetical protein